MTEKADSYDGFNDYNPLLDTDVNENSFSKISSLFDCSSRD